MLLRQQQLHVAGGAKGVLLLHRLQAALRGGVGRGQRRQHPGVVVHAVQGVGDAAQGVEHHALVVRGGGVQRGQGSALFCRQCGVEQGLRDLAQQTPHGGAAAKQGAGAERLRAQLGAEVDLRVQPRHGNAVFGAGSVQQCLRALNVGALAHQL